MEPYLRTVRGHSGFSVPPAFRNRDIGTLLTGETVSRSHQEIISIDVQLMALFQTTGVVEGYRIDEATVRVAVSR